MALIFDEEVVEPRLWTVVLLYHKPPASDNGDRMQHHKLSSAYNVVVIALASTYSVTFSTPTRHYTQNARDRVLSVMAWLQQQSNFAIKLLQKPVPFTYDGKKLERGYT